MQNYELFYTLPGTLTESDVEPKAAQVNEILTEVGAELKEVKDLGKSRLAYPMSQIRYGYFRVCRFQAEPEHIRTVNDKLRVMPEILRSNITLLGNKSFVLPSRISAVSDVFLRVDESAASAGDVIEVPAMDKPAKPASALESAEETVRQVSSTKAARIDKPKAAKKTETKAENVKLDEIDKKLDELLESDVSGL